MNNINEKAMLVRLSISQWTARKYDKTASKSVDAAYHATGAGRFNKALIAQDAIQAITKKAGAARTWHYENTLPWTDDGSRILTAANFMDYSGKMREFRQDFESVVYDFINNYPDLVRDSQVRLNGLWNAKDYPKDIASRFSFSVDIMPIPIFSDFRVSLNSEDIQEIQEDISRKTENALAMAHKDLYKRLSESISHMAEKLNEPEGIFRDSLVNNLRDLVKLLPKLDLQNDPELESIRQQAEQKLCQANPDLLRVNPAIRKEVARDAKSILDAMANIYGA